MTVTDGAEQTLGTTTSVPVGWARGPIPTDASASNVETCVSDYLAQETSPRPSLVAGAPQDTRYSSAHAALGNGRLSAFP